MTRPPDPGGARPSDDDLVHRGVRWQRAKSGALRWRDEDAARWVRYRPGDDAPPRPPGWERPGVTARSGIDRPPWRSPYRLVPLALFLFIIAFGTYQAIHGSGGQDAAEAKAAAALVGKCLARDGGSGAGSRYGTKAVDCAAPTAAVRVQSVLPGTPGAPACPAGTSSVELAYVGVRFPHQLCVVPAHTP